MISRRRFLKSLAFAVPALAVSPGALAIADGAVQPPKTAMPEHLSRCEWLTFDELQARFSKDLDKNPILRGELGIYNGITIVNAK